MGCFFSPRRPVLAAAAAVAAVVVVAAAATAPLRVVAWPRYRERVPNGFGFAGCEALGHVGCDGGKPLNGFGRDFHHVHKRWTVDVCMADSDGLSATQLAAARAHPPSPALLPASTTRITAPWSVRLHGAAMAVVFLVLFPLGVAAAAPPRSDGSGGGGSWFALHQGLQLGGVGMAAAGLAAILSHNSVFLPSAFWRDPHGYYGLAVLVGTAVQAAVGLCRPAAGAPLRAVWGMVHQVGAATLAIGSLAALLTGLRSVAWVYGYPAAGVRRPPPPVDDATPYEAVETGEELGDGWTESVGEARGGDAKAEWGDFRTTLWWTFLVLRVGGGAVVVGWVLLVSGRV
ncbi:hypothetical protein MMPV_007224 [Pyropia vietnamensis]